METKLSPLSWNMVVHKWLRVPYNLHVRAFKRSKQAKTTILFIHGLGSTGKMWTPVINKLSSESNGKHNIVSVDLLGSGKSPKPYWETYNAKLQARALLRTYLKLRLRTPLIVVGHSLGSLVAIEFAKRYPLLTKKLILCSPPMYRPASDVPGFSRDKLLPLTYEKLLASPKLVMKLYNYGKVTKLDPSLELTEDNMPMFAATMRSSIINQTATQDIRKLKIPIHLIHGAFDPVVVKSNLIKLQKAHPNITLTTVAASHPLNDAYITSILGDIEQGQ